MRKHLATDLHPDLHYRTEFRVGWRGLPVKTMDVDPSFRFAERSWDAETLRPSAVGGLCEAEVYDHQRARKSKEKREKGRKEIQMITVM